MLNLRPRRILLPLTLVAVFATPLGTNLATGDPEPVATVYSPPPTRATSPTILDHVGIDPAKQQRGPTSPSGKTIYRSTNGDHVCILDETASGHCGGLRQIENGKAFGGTLCTDDLAEHLTRITGAVPAAATDVVLRTGAGTTYTAKPVIGTVVFEVPRDEAGADDHVDITWTLSTGGSKTIQLPMPPFIKGANCA